MPGDAPNTDGVGDRFQRMFCTEPARRHHEGDDNKMNRLLLLGAAVALAALAAPARAADVPGDIEQLSADTYVIRRDERPIYSAGTVSRQKQKIVDDARDFAAQQGKLAVELAFDEKEHMLNEYYGTMSWEYRFRLVDDPDVRSMPDSAPAAATAAPSAAATAATAAAPAPPPPPTPSAEAAIPSQRPPLPPDTRSTLPERDIDEIYDQLTKLDELRQKGILTDAEFETLKQRVLASD